MQLILLLSLMCQTPAVPVSPSIRLPVVESPTPPPLPPNSVQVLPADKYYVIDSDVECFVRTMPKGLLSVAVEAGPIKLPTKSLVEGGKAKFKTYSGKFIYVVESTGDGRVELLVVPKGVAADKDILQRSIDAQTGAKPPPDPIIPDPPKPDALTGLAKSAFDWASSCTSPTRAKDAAALAKNFRTVASAQAAGVYVNVASMSNELRVLNQTALETDDLWRTAFFVPLNAELTKSVKTLADYGAACKEVAKGLEAIR